MTSVLQRVLLIFLITWPIEAKPEVFITVTSSRKLKLNWKIDDIEPSDEVFLHNSSPEKNDTSNVIYITTPSSSGSIVSSMKFQKQSFNLSSLNQSQCLGYWISYQRNSQVIATNCLKTQPTWMYDSKSFIGDAKLLKLMIPGTHNSATHTEEGSIFDSIVKTQDVGVFEQLVYGIRYLDLRIGCYNGRFWINHDILKIDKRLEDVLDDVSKFINNTKEVVLLDFHRFPAGFKKYGGKDNMTRYHLLVDLIKEKLGDHMLPVQFNVDVTMNEIWKSNKRAIVMFNTRLRRIEPFLLWTGSHHYWADTTDLNELKTFLNNKYSYYTSTRFTSGMAHLTIKPSNFFFNFFGRGTKYYADVVNDEVDEWFRDLWWENANIVASDFFLGNNLIEISIKSNIKRFFKLK